MLFRDAFRLLAQHIVSLRYKIEAASRDTRKEASILNYQSFLSHCLVNYYVLANAMQVTPTLASLPLFDPFAEVIPELINQMRANKIQPVNSTLAPTPMLLQQEPYASMAKQHLENLEEYPWLFNTIFHVRNLMIVDPQPPSSSAPATTPIPSTSSTLTPCRFITVVRVRPRARPRWLGSVDNLCLLARNSSPLSLRPPATIDALLTRLVQYLRGMVAVITTLPANSPQRSQLIKIRLECEIAYSLILEYLAQDLMEETDPASKFILHHYYLMQLDTLQKLGIARVFNEGDVYPPVENSRDQALCLSVMPLVEELYSDAHQQFERAMDARDISRGKIFSDLADVANLVIDRLGLVLEQGPALNYDATDYTPIADFSL